MKKLGRNEPCPCGSGEKYKHCCWNKSFEWVVDEKGNVKKQVPISPELRKMYESEAVEFRQAHGRDRYPDELIFSEMGHPEHVEAEFVDIMKKAGIKPEFIYAFEKTGRVVTVENMSKISDLELEEWNDAIHEYHRRVADGDTPDV